MASIKERNGSFQIRVYLGEDSSGKKQFKNTTYKPKAKTPKAIEKEVKDYARDFEKRVLNGEYLTGEEMTFNSFFQIWLRDFASKQLTEAEIEEYTKTINRVFMPTLGNKKMTAISPLLLQKIVTDLENKGLKASTIKKYFACISSVLNRAFKANIIHENPCQRLLLPRIESNPNEIKYFDRDQAITFLNALKRSYTVHHPEKVRKNGRILPASDEVITISKQFQAFFTLAVYSGCRRGELISLTWEDIDMNRCLLKITKNTRASKKNGQYIKDPKSKAGFRTFSVPVICMDLLAEWKEEQMQLCKSLGSAWCGFRDSDYDQNYIFIQNDGKQMNLDTPLHKFRDILTYYNDSVSDPSEKLPVITLHDLRHTSASIMIASGYVDIETIARRLGHSDVKMTLNRYGHALPSQDEKAALALETMLMMPEEKKPSLIVTDRKDQIQTVERMS